MTYYVSSGTLNLYTYSRQLVGVCLQKMDCCDRNVNGAVASDRTEVVLATTNAVVGREVVIVAVAAGRVTNVEVIASRPADLTAKCL